MTSLGIIANRPGFDEKWIRCITCCRKIELLIKFWPFFFHGANIIHHKMYLHCIHFQKHNRVISIEHTDGRQNLKLSEFVSSTLRNFVQLIWLHNKQTSLPKLMITSEEKAESKTSYTLYILHPSFIGGYISLRCHYKNLCWQYLQIRFSKFFERVFTSVVSKKIIVRSIYFGQLLSYNIVFRSTAPEICRFWSLWKGNMSKWIHSSNLPTPTLAFCPFFFWAHS